MPYKILFLNWQDIKHPLGGGAEVYNHEILKRIVKKGHSVTLLCSHYSDLQHEESIDGIRVVRSGSRSLFNYAVLFASKRLLAEDSYDIVIDAVNKIPFLSPLYIKKIPVICIVHHIFKTTIFKEVSLPSALYVYLFEQFIKPVYRKVPFVVISESTKHDMIKSGISENRISIVPCCVDLTHYTTSNQPKNDLPLIGYLGRIKRYKSVDHLIDAFALVKKSFPEAQLVIVGDGDNLPELKAQVHNYNLDEAVRFTGFVDEETKVKILQQCHVVVNPSIKEGWGLTIIEANACGTTTVAADVPGLHDSVLDGKTGLLYPYGDREKLAEHLLSVLTDVRLRERLTNNALEWAAKFNWDDSAETLLELISATKHKNKS